MLLTKKGHIRHKDQENLMGQRVEFSTILYPKYESGRRVWKGIPVFSSPVSGWIVGFSWKRNGRLVASSGEGYEYEPAYFVADESVPCVLIARTPRKLPVPVPVSEVL